MSGDGVHHIGAICYDRGIDVDPLLVAVSDGLRQRGYRLGGVLQNAVGDRGSCAPSVHVVDLQSGALFNIWESRGVGSRGCRLNEGGLIDVEPAIMAAIDARVDLLLINRFGRAEACGGGFVGCFSAALEAGIMVLTAVRESYLGAWTSFDGGLGTNLDPDVATVLDWATQTRFK